MASKTGVYSEPESESEPARPNSSDPTVGQPVEQTLARRSLFGRVMIGAIRVYQQTLSKALPPSCRFYPSCSEYTAQAIAKYGPLKGGWMGVRRILRCHPMNPGGYDPVP